MKIAVIGYSCTGKTTLTHELAALHPDHKVYHTDEYQSVASYGEAPHLIHDEILNSKSQDIIVSGVHAYRILRRGAELRSLFFDVVIHCKTPTDVRIDRYRRERKADVERQPATERSLDKIFAGYMGLCSGLGKTPHVIEYWT